MLDFDIHRTYPTERQSTEMVALQSPNSKAVIFLSCNFLRKIVAEKSGAGGTSE